MNLHSTTAWRKFQRHLCVAIALVCSATCSADDKTPLVFGVFPYLPTAQLEQIYAPVAADLSIATGREVQLRTRPSFDLFREELVQKRYDLVFIQPFAYAQVASANGYRSVAHPAEALKAIFVVRSDSDIREFKDLRNSTVAMPPKGAAVSLLGRQALTQYGLVPGTDIRLTYQNNHAACLRAVLIRKAAACVTAAPPLQIFTQRTGMIFRVLAHSDPIPGSTFAVHERLPAAMRSAIARRIVSWDQSAAGKVLLESLKLSPFVNSSDEDYLPVREILRTINQKDHRNSKGSYSDAPD
ncbi:MAG: phosphate/phosphite/phosphonate ABC transporter substrate-binding protein [Thiogranum sp.]|nr:phosphate/phosphite/phosphonate ABC transporter substrate-binding protein [Thiogranum sp.]